MNTRWPSMTSDEYIRRGIEEADRQEARRPPWDTIDTHPWRWGAAVSVLLAGSIGIWWAIIDLIIRVWP